jgi:hypothetical protein
MPDFYRWFSPNRRNYNEMAQNTLPKWPYTIPNGRTLYRMAVKYTNWPMSIPNFLIPKALQNAPKSRFLVRKYVYHLATLSLNYVFKTLGRHPFGKIPRL